MTGPSRRPRGLRRTEALLDAAVELLEEGGFAGVGHRAVAERAGLPLAATTYYFRSRDDLVTRAFTRLVDRDLATMRDRLGAPVQDTDGVAHAIAAAFAPRDERDRVRGLALCELYVQAGRDPALRPLARSWTDGYHRLVAELLNAADHPHTPADVRMITSLVNGLYVEAMVEFRPNAVQAMMETVSRLLAAVRASHERS